MYKILVPVDGSDNALRVVKFVITQASNSKAPLELHLLNVQPPFPGTIRGVAEQARQYHEEQGNAALAGARKLLDDAKVPYTHHINVGEVSVAVALQVKQLKCDHVIMGTRGMNSVANLMMGSTATKVLHAVEVPVTFVK